MRRLWLVGGFATVLMAFWGSPAHAVQSVTVDFTNAPQGTHFVTGTPSPTCTVTAQTVTCPAAAFELAGVGNTNATATLTAQYSAIVDCFNPGANRNNPIESHETSFTETQAATLTPNRNGQLSVGARSVSPTAAELDDATTCPNANWDAQIRGGSLTLESFTYSLTFAGFTEPAVLITGP